MNTAGFAARVSAYVDARRERLVEIARDLIRIPSENTPPSGNEQACQDYVCSFLRRIGVEATLYHLNEVPGLKQHPFYLEGRNYDNRPNVGARLHGAGAGRSLILSGHVDTVPRGSFNWTRDPFSGTVEGNRLLGRGANDMKGGVATNLFVLEALREMNVGLRGDLLFETVVDEEFGGANGTLAGRLAGFNADAAILSEPSFLRICPAQRGGRLAHVILTATGGVLSDGRFPEGVIGQLEFFLRELRRFADHRRTGTKVHRLYARFADPVPVSVTKVITSPWGTQEPITVPEICKLEVYWQSMPGETQQDIDREFLRWMESLSTIACSPLSRAPEVNFSGRFLPGSAIDAEAEIVTEFSHCTRQMLEQEPAIEGIGGPCDLFIFHQAAKTPAILWGARGGNTHGGDEYVEIDSLAAAAKALLFFVCQWCGSGA